MWQALLDLLFPRRSLLGEEGEWITPFERQRLVFFPVREETALLRKRGITHLDRLVAASTYAHTPLLRRAIHTFKYGRIRDLDGELGQLIAESAPPTEILQPVLCPVPLHWMRRFARGFNQAERLARVVARKRGLPLRHLLQRIRPTGSQTRRSREERLTALTDAFRCTDHAVPKFVVLIDDLSTTGATLEACAKALKDAGVERVEGWVVAHG